MTLPTQIAGILRGDDVPSSGPLALALVSVLILAPVLTFLASGVVGPAAEVAALVAVTPCGVLSGRIATAWRRDRRLRSYWR